MYEYQELTLTQRQAAYANLTARLKLRARERDVLDKMLTLDEILNAEHLGLTKLVDLAVYDTMQHVK